MDNREFFLGKAMVIQGENSFSFSSELYIPEHLKVAYDLDLLYVECRLCGNPVLWDRGKTRHLVHSSGIDTSLLDSECLILSEGCPKCRPDAGIYHLQVVRVAAISAEDILLLSAQKGNA